MGDVAERIDWIGFWDNFCIVLEDSQLDHFQNYTVQATQRIASRSARFWVVVQGH